MSRHRYVNQVIADELYDYDNDDYDDDEDYDDDGGWAAPEAADPPAAPPTSAPHAQHAAPSSAPAPELATLCDMGFTASAARGALDAAGGSLEEALASLLSTEPAAAVPSAPPSDAAPPPAAAPPRATTQAARGRGGRGSGHRGGRDAPAWGRCGRAAPPAVARATPPKMPPGLRIDSAHNNNTAAPPPCSAECDQPSSSSGRRGGAPLAPSSQLNMVVIGHVDAGKSTLMGR